VWWSVVRYLVLTVAVLRATRLVTTDKLGGWLLEEPSKKWAAKHEGEAKRRKYREFVEEYRKRGAEVPLYDHWYSGEGDEPLSWQGKLVSGLDCPFCVGFWLGLLALIGEATLGRVPGVRVLWRLGVAAFAMNYVVGHVSHRLD